MTQTTVVLEAGCTKVLLTLVNMELLVDVATKIFKNIRALVMSQIMNFKDMLYYATLAIENMMEEQMTITELCSKDNQFQVE